MNTVENNNEELEIDLSELFRLLKKQWHLIVISMVIMTLVSGVFTVFFIDKKYSSSFQIYLKPKVTEGVVDNTTLNVNKQMVKNYVIMLKADTILAAVSEQVGVDLGTVKGAVSVSQVNDSDIIKVTSITTDPELSKAITENLITEFYESTSAILQVDNMFTLDEAKINTTPVSPNLKKNLVIGALLGVMLSCGYVFLGYMLDTRLKRKEEAERVLGVPVLGIVPYYKG